jgi:cytochrome c-type biogenesis protein CcmE
MKKVHIALLVLIFAAIAVLVSFLQTAATYETIAEAKVTPGKFVHVAVQLDKSFPVEYDATKDANYLSFQAMDSSGEKMKVIYRQGEIPNLMVSEKLVLKGKYVTDHFECKDVQTKCPSKYKEEMKITDTNLQHTSDTNLPAIQPNTSSTNSTDKKY